MSTSRERCTTALVSALKRARGVRVCGVDCTSLTGWRNIMAYATPAERVRIYSLLCMAFSPGANASRREAVFTPKQLVLDDGTIALGRVESAVARFPALTAVTVDLSNALRYGWSDSRRKKALVRLCSLKFLVRLDLVSNDIAEIPAEIGALTCLRELRLSKNRIRVLSAPVRNALARLTSLERLHLDENKNPRLRVGANPGVVVFPSAVGGLTELRFDAIFTAPRLGLDIKVHGYHFTNNDWSLTIESPCAAGTAGADAGVQSHDVIDYINGERLGCRQMIDAMQSLKRPLVVSFRRPGVYVR